MGFIFHISGQIQGNRYHFRTSLKNYSINYRVNKGEIERVSVISGGLGADFLPLFMIDSSCGY
ncbi:hypothetical protein AGMMS50268_30730 [Spirochaetia bacterium]|nr:hypothetical protein AGMMS50268_30730 [Spirochaetia bacterium]